MTSKESPKNGAEESYNSKVAADCIKRMPINPISDREHFLSMPK